MSFKAFSEPSERIPAGIHFRKICEEDHGFLSLLYASTREQEMELVNWSREQKDIFLQMQFEAQHRFYMEQFTDAEFFVIERGAQSIGRIYIDRRKDEIRLIDIALLPDFRNQHIGTVLLKEVLKEGQASKLPVGIHVEKNNPAMRLYLRLGFEAVEDQGVYDLMRWQPVVQDASQEKTAS